MYDDYLADYVDRRGEYPVSFEEEYDWQEFYYKSWLLEEDE